MKPGWIKYRGLGLALIVGVGLRFWHLDTKPLWMDETITALFSLGQDYTQVPIQTLLSLNELTEIFTWIPTSCTAITQTVATQSTHPPVFFCLLHGWVGLLQPHLSNLAWALRSLPALLGVGAIAAIYGLARTAYSPVAGTVAAGLVAVSPFAVYLSQEARHYTLPLLLVAFALTALVAMQQDLQLQRSPRLWVWLSWIGVNVLGFYIHYFFLLALVAQLLTLLGWLGWQRHWRAISWVGVSTAAIVLLYLPWALQFLSHISRPETDWLRVARTQWLEYLAPLYQMAAGLVIMVVMLPVEDQPLWLTLLSGMAMLLFIIWLCRWLWQGWRHLWRRPELQPATVLLAGFVGAVLAEYLAIALLTGKDLTLAPRYNFIYYPAVAALLAGGLTHLSQYGHLIRRSVLLVGVISSLCVDLNLAFPKPFEPAAVSQDISASRQPQLVIKAFDNWQDVALGLSFALALEQQYPQLQQSSLWGFWPSSAIAVDTWRLPLDQQAQLPPSVWLIGSLNRQTNQPTQIILQATAEAKAICTPTSTHYPAFGVERRRYVCNPQAGL